jgi:Ca2+/Na+ antiporter
VDHQPRAALFITREVNNMPRPISEQIQGTYFRLRFIVAIIGLLFPVILYFGGTMNGFGLRGSMSAYYWATAKAPCPCGDEPEHSGKCKNIEKNSDDEKACLALPAVAEAGSMRSYFVGFLFAVGAILFANKGYSRREDILLNIAGVSALVIALFPMPWTGKPRVLYWVHGTAAIIFFLAIASVAAFCSHATVRLINDPTQRKVYMGAYWFLAVSMFAAPVAAYILNVNFLRRDNAIYWVEFCGIWAFAAYWIVKGIEMSGPDTEKKVADGVCYDPKKLHVVASVKNMLSGD